MVTSTAPRCMRLLARSSRTARPQSTTLTQAPIPTIRTFTTTTSRDLATRTEISAEVPGEVQTPPRWSYTPAAMKAPFHPRIKDPTKHWEANASPARLDAMYNALLGPQGDQLLSEETKWLAVTHKSFDQGRRGFNDRLAFLGKRLLQVQASLAFLRAPTTPNATPSMREPYTHPALEGLPNLTSGGVAGVLSSSRLSRLAQSYGIDKVTRWKPKNPANMQGSGCDVVYTSSVYAIVGALALERGGAKANEVAREVVLKQLGL